MWLAKPVIPGRTLSLALAGSSQLFWASLLSRVARDLRGPREGCIMGQGMSRARSLATCCAAAPVVVARHLVSRRRLENAPRIWECVSWRPLALGFLAEE